MLMLTVDIQPITDPIYAGIELFFGLLSLAISIATTIAAVRMHKQ